MMGYKKKKMQVKRKQENTRKSSKRQKKLRKKLRGFLTKQEQTLYQNTVPQPIS
jgi:hypothetical protein